MVKSIGTIECSVVKNFLQIINTDFKILTNGVVGDPRLQKIQFTYMESWRMFNDNIYQL